MSGGPSFLGDLGGFDLGSLLEQLRMAPQGFDPQAAAPASTMGLNPSLPQPLPIRGAGDDTSGHGVGPVDKRQPSIAMNEDQTQALERAQAGPSDAAALGGGSVLDRLLYDRSGFGGGPNGFTGSADPYGARNVPLPPSRPSDADLLSAPTATGSLSSPRRPTGSSNVAPAPGVTAADTGNPASSNLQPVNSFDPLTGQPVSGSPKMLQAPGMGGPTAGGGQVATAGGASQGGSFLERFAQGLNNPAVGNLLLNVGIGLMSNRGFGPGIAAGLQGYQQSQAGSVKSLLEQYKLQNEIQGQQATRAFLRSKGLSPAAVEAGTLNPSLLAQINKDPQQFTVGGNVFLGRSDQDPSTWQKLGPSSGPPTGYRLAADGQSLEFIPGGEADPAVKERNAKAVATDKEQTPLLDIEARRKVGIPDNDTRAAWADPNGKVTFNDGPPLIQGRPGQTVYERGSLRPLLTVPAAKPDGYDTETKLRGEFSKQLGSFADVHDGYGRLIAATKQRQENPGSVSPASDISLIFGYMKMLDPGSVVREGEYATAKNAAGIPERVTNAYNKALNGEFLTDTQRRDFLNQASELYGTARKTAEGVADRYRNLATSYGVDPGRSVYLPDAPTPPKIGQQSQPGGGAAARFQALMNSGMSKADAFAQMRKEGL